MNAVAVLWCDVKFPLLFTDGTKELLPYLKGLSQLKSLECEACKVAFATLDDELYKNEVLQPFVFCVFVLFFDESLIQLWSKSALQ